MRYGSAIAMLVLGAALIGPQARAAPKPLVCPAGSDGEEGVRSIGPCGVEIRAEADGTCRARVVDASRRSLVDARGRSFRLEEVTGRDINADGYDEIVVRGETDEKTYVYSIVSCGADPPFVKELRSRYGVWYEKATRGRYLIVVPDEGFRGFPELRGAAPDELAWPVIRLELRERALVDAGAQFTAYYDVEIRRLRAALHPTLLRQFRNGTLDDPDEAGRVRARVLKIVLSYLYSGRDKQAWKELARMWPKDDVARVKAAILEARAHGSLASVDKPGPDR